MRIPLIHCWLINSNGGGEKLTKALCELFPQAAIFTHFSDPARFSTTIKQYTIKKTFSNKLQLNKRFYKHYMLLGLLALKQLDSSAHDLIISTESGLAKEVIVPTKTKHLCQCHTSMRYLWNHHNENLAHASPLVLIMALIFHCLRMWDVLFAKQADRIVAKSSVLATCAKRWWGYRADENHSPVDTVYFKGFIKEKPEGYYLFADRLVRYKRADMCTL